jgi:hypothetical protein
VQARLRGPKLLLQPPTELVRRHGVRTGASDVPRAARGHGARRRRVDPGTRPGSRRSYRVVATDVGRSGRFRIGALTRAKALRAGRGRNGRTGGESLGWPLRRRQGRERSTHEASFQATFSIVRNRPVHHPARLGHDPDGFGAFQPPGYACLASASETVGTMMTSSPCFQFTPNQAAGTGDEGGRPECNHFFLARPWDDLLGVAVPRLIALDGVGLPAEVSQVLDARGHRAHVCAAPRARLLREPTSLLVGPVGIPAGRQIETGRGQGSRPAGSYLRTARGLAATALAESAGRSGPPQDGPLRPSGRGPDLLRRLRIDQQRSAWMESKGTQTLR